MASEPLSRDPAVQDLDQLYNQAKSGRSWLEPVWILNLAYYGGDQWLAWNGRQLFQPSLRPNRITVVENFIQPAVRTEIAKMMKNRPRFTVPPASADDGDVNASALSEQVMRYLWDHLNFREITSKALLWSRICGAGFVKCTWDSTVGESTEVLVASASNKVLTDANNQPMRPSQVDPGELAASMNLPPEAIRVKRVCRGEIRIEAKSPFQMFVDPIADTFDEAEWVIEESIKSREYVRQRYDIDLAPDTPANPGMVEVKLGSFLPGSSPYKGIKLREFWAKPSSKYPGGRRCVWAQGKVLFEEGQPFDSQPYVMFSGIPYPGRLWPTSIVEQLRGPQTELNKVVSQMAENRNRLGNPTLLASKQAVQDPEKFNDSVAIPGGVYYYDDVGSPNAIPKYLEAPGLPEYVVEEPARILGSMQEIAGQHEVSSAQVPPGVTAASAISLLQEADDTRLGPAIEDFERQGSKLGQKALELVANYYTDQRTLRIAGDNGAWQIHDFRGAAIKGATHVQMEVGLPQSKAEKQAGLTDLLRMLAQSGQPLQGQQLAEFLQDWDLGGADKLIEQYTRDESQVNRENLLLAQGTPININLYDDDQAHVDLHEAFQKSARYQSLPDQIKQVFEMHVGAHRERLSQQQQQALQMQMQMAGQVPPNMTAAALQDEHELSQLQGHTQLQMDVHGHAQKQGFDAAGAEQQQRQGEEQHRQRLQHGEEQHQQRLQQAEQLHQAKLQQIARQAQQRPQNPQRKAA